MKGSRFLAALALAAGLGLAATALAGGFNIYEASARATALGGAFTATADDASALFYNPAGMAFLEGTMIDANLMPIVPGSKFTAAEWPDPGATGRTVKQSFPVPGLYGVHRTSGPLAFGLGVYAPFGLGVKWQDRTTWVGRRSSFNVDLASIYATPAVAWRLNENAAVSVGVDVGWAKIKLSNFNSVPLGGLSTLTNVIQADIDGSSRLNVTPCAGVMWRPAPRLSLGAMYHHNKTMQVRNQDATLTNVAPEALRPTVDAQIAALGGTDHKVSGDLKFPWILTTGVSYRFSDRLRGEFDLVRVGWSKFDNLTLEFDNPAMSQTIEEQYKDVWQLRFGADVTMSERWGAMFGYCHDNSPQPYGSMSPLLPDANREDFSLGLQYHNAGWRLTGSYMAVMFHDRSNVVDGQDLRFSDTLPLGTYDSIAHIFGLGLGRTF
ncbi:MAG: OmpP1/FadL family transporter [Candidatus Krumholzibacteriia bacterium]